MSPRLSSNPTGPSRRALLGGALVGGAALLSACASPSGPPAGASTTTSADGGSPSGSFTLDAATTPRLNALFDEIFTSTGIAGMAGAVWLGNDVWTRTSGYSDLASRTPYDPAAFVRIASITKPFTATAVLQLVDAGRLKLDDVLERFVPGIANGSSITIRNLLDMTSGVYEYTNNVAFNARWSADPTMPWTFDDTLALIKANQPMFAPGTDLYYADSNYVILGEIVRMVSGAPIETVVTDAVITPLGLTQTSWPTATTIPTPHPTGYVPQGIDPNNPDDPFTNAAHPPKPVTELNPAVPGASGAMISTLRDLRAWGREIATGSLLKPATQAERLRSRRFNGAKIDIGYGFGCERVHDFVGHNGAIYGFSSVVFHNAAANLTIAAVGNESTNSTTPTATFAYQFIKRFFPDQWR